MPIWLLGLLKSKWTWYILAGIAAFCALLWVIGAVKGGIKDFEQGIRDDERQIYTLQEQARNIKELEERLKFEQEQKEKAEAEVAEWRDATVNLAGNVQSGRVIIRDQIAAGTLQDGQISPVIGATMDVLDSLKKQQFGDKDENR